MVSSLFRFSFTHFLRFSTGEAVTFLEVFPVLGFPNLNKAAILAQTHIREQNKNDENAKTLVKMKLDFVSLVFMRFCRQ